MVKVKGDLRVFFFLMFISICLMFQCIFQDVITVTQLPWFNMVPTADQAEKTQNDCETVQIHWLHPLKAEF